MNLDPWPLIGGPVLSLELLLRSRRRVWLWRGVYLAWLLLGSSWLYLEFLSDYRRPYQPSASEPPPTQRKITLLRSQLASRFVGDFTEQLLQQQLILLILVTPALTAGAITAEKERRTLEYLLTTEVGSWELIAGKVLGRMVVVANLAVLGLPLLISAASLAGLALERTLAALAQAAVLLFALSSGGILASALTRRTQDALLGCYSLGLLIYLALAVIRDQFALPFWLSPFDILNRLLFEADPWRRYVVHLAVWLLLGSACLLIAYWRVRATSLAQLEVRKRFRDLLGESRPPVSDDPIRWKERYLVGIAPLPWLRGIPRWFGMLAVLSFSLVLNGFAVTAASAPWDRAAVKAGDWSALPRLFTGADPGDVAFELVWLGLVLVVLSALVVGVRCAGAVREEQAKGTWESLLLTPLELGEILTAKASGIVAAALPHCAVYLLPMLVLSLMGGVMGLLILALFVALTMGGMFLAAVLGIAASGGSAPPEVVVRPLPRPRQARARQPSR